MSNDIDDEFELVGGYGQYDFYEQQDAVVEDIKENVSSPVPSTEESGRAILAG